MSPVRRPADAPPIWQVLPTLPPRPVLAVPARSPAIPPASPPNPLPDVIIGGPDDAQPSLPLASDGVRRWAWQGRWGAMLIEVVGDEVFVNGQRVEPHRA